MSIWQILLGLGMVGIGIVGLIYHRQVYDFTGRLNSVESRWAGGSSSFLKLLAILFILFGLLTATGLINWIVKPIGDYLNGLIPVKS